MTFFPQAIEVLKTLVIAIGAGLGVWGAKYRIGTQSEYVVATLKP